MKKCGKCGEADIAKFGPNKARADGLQSQCRDCIRSQNRSNMRAKRLAVKDGRIAAAKDEEEKWKLILRKYGDYAWRGSSEYLVYEHALDLEYSLDQLDRQGSAINALEMQANAGCYGDQGEWFKQVRRKVAEYRATH